MKLFPLFLLLLCLCGSAFWYVYSDAWQTELLTHARCTRDVIVAVIGTY